MTLQDELTIERFKIIKDRQKYFTELSKDSYDLYLKAFIYIISGSVALLSVKEKFNIPDNVLEKLINILILLITVVGTATILQIGFCLFRWYKYKFEEKEINPQTKIEWWAWVYEGLYIMIIIASLIIVLANKNYLTGIIKIIEKHK